MSKKSKKSTEVAVRPRTSLEAYVESSLAEKAQFAETLAAANSIMPEGLLSSVAYKNPRTSAVEKQAEPGKLLAIMEYGASIGMAPMAAVMNIHIIEGKPSISSAGMVGLLRLRGYEVDYEETGTVAGGDFACTAILTTPKGREYRSTYTPQDALQAGLIDSYRPNAEGVWEVRARSRSDKALNWETITTTMCQWRAASNVARKGASEVFLGAIYTPDEISRNAVDEGELESTITERLARPEPAERDWAAEILATETIPEFRRLKEEALAAGMGQQLTHVFAEHVGNLQARRRPQPEPAAAEPEIHDAEVVEDDDEGVNVGAL